MKTTSLLTLVALLTLLANSSRVGAQGTDFTYQGRLLDNGAPANGSFDLQFLLYDALDGGIQQGVTLSRFGTETSNGAFTTTLDFGPDIFTGPRRWLEIRVAPVNTTDFTTLRPRQALTPTPYAMYAPEAGTAATASRVAWTALTGIPPGLADGVDDNTTYVAGSGLTLAGQSFSLDTTVTDARYWKLAGNSGTTPGVSFLGTTDNQALDFRVNNTRALRLEPGSSNSVNVIGGWAGNGVAPGVAGATVSGGGAGDWFGFPSINLVEAHFGTVSGGRENTIQTNADAATIGGGYLNTIQTDAFSATIGGGIDNTIQTNANAATIAGGYFNTVQPDAYNGTIGGGEGNTIQTNAAFATIGGGINNAIQPYACNGTIGGGAGNTIQTNAYNGTIPGGNANSVGGDYGFAAGQRAKANHGGAFVWADSSSSDFASTAGNQFNVRAVGGVRIVTGIDDFGDPEAGVSLNANDTSWNVISDRSAKKNFRPADGREILERLARLPIEHWNYKWETDAAVPHLGPTAQDFKAAFYPGRDDKTISTLEADGVALAAIQGLNQKLEQTLKEKEARIEALEKRVEKLDKLVTALTETGGAQ